MELIIGACFIGIFLFGFLGNGLWSSRCFIGLVASGICYGLFSHPTVIHVVVLWMAIILGKEMFSNNK